MKFYVFNKKVGLSVFLGALFIIAMSLAPQAGIAAGPVQPRGNGPTSILDYLQQQNELNQTGKEGMVRSAPKSGPRALTAPNGKKQLEPCTAVLDSHYNLYVPIVDIGNDYYWLEMVYTGDGYFLFTGFDYQDPTDFNECNHSYLTSSTTVYVPFMSFGGYYYWLELTYFGCDSTGCWFGLTDFGPIYF
ncbi:MAG: hypothetical protein HQK58_13490 [Deltaproteobacteria bacterium]|nr:hypothetical protein [Deltaproteobacteria bacterium]MBF0524360.1 hypothetical protein [Deltaproteobacteria bacterium]